MQNKHFKRVDYYAQRLATAIEKADNGHDRARLDRLMLQALPQRWQAKVVSAGVQNGIWTLFVQNGSDAHQLRYLSGEITLRLSKHLPHPPNIKVMVRPDIWQNSLQRTLPPAHLYPKRYSDVEAEAVLRKYLQSNPFKNNTE